MQYWLFLLKKGAVSWIFSASLQSLPYYKMILPRLSVADNCAEYVKGIMLSKKTWQVYIHYSTDIWKSISDRPRTL